MPEQPLSIAPLADRDPRGSGWPETRFRESFREGWFSPAEEVDDASERNGHGAAPETKLRSGRPSVRVADNILVKFLIKVAVASLYRVNEFFFNKAGHLPAGPSGLIQKENLRNR